jgi:hypothetical protein
LASTKAADLFDGLGAELEQCGAWTKEELEERQADKREPLQVLLPGLRGRRSALLRVLPKILNIDPSTLANEDDGNGQETR